METATLTLTDFLLARIAEDEAAARGVEAELKREFGMDYSNLSSPLAGAGSGYMDYPVLTIDPTRVLAECEAKRRIVGRHGIKNIPAYGDRGALTWCQCLHDAWPCPDMLALAAVYADHPDYRDEWKP